MADYTFAAFADELQKIASRLRKAVEVTRWKPPGMPSDLQYYSLGLRGKSIGRLKAQGRQVLESFIEPEYRGMGLGKKLYGEALKEGPLKSDKLITEQAAGVWRGMKRRKGYVVEEAAGLKPTKSVILGSGEKMAPSLMTGTRKPAFEASLNIPQPKPPRVVTTK